MTELSKKDTLEKIYAIHATVYRGFKYITDKEQHGVDEDWRMPVDVTHVRGDCDDHALACRKLLREAGIESRLIICSTETGEKHLVCASRNYILDNRYSQPKTVSYLERIGYKWLYISGLNPNEEWNKYE